MATNILMLPLVDLTAETGTNEDWLDGIAFETDDPVPVPLSALGIRFEMQMRTNAPDVTVVLEASTTDGTLLVRDNVVSMNVRAEHMGRVPPGSYVMDIIGTADGFTRIIIRGAVDVFEGVTRPDVVTA